MPIHDWTRVDEGVFHDFHHSWIHAITRHLNSGVLPDDCYAMLELFAAGSEPDMPAQLGPQFAETDMEFYRRKQNMVTVRHEKSGDRLSAVVAVVEPANKSTESALDEFVRKVSDFVERRVHLLILDLFPPGRHDPDGIHGAIWSRVAGQRCSPSLDKPLTLMAYESDQPTTAYVEPLAVGDVLHEMPLFLEPGRYVYVALEATYQNAWEGVPRRWKPVIEGHR